MKIIKKNIQDRGFIDTYINKIIKEISFDENIIQKILSIKKLLLNCKKNNKKVIIFGNGGSSAIASHFSVDLTKNSRIRCVNFNEYDLITCFSNDFGYENWILKAIDYYGDKGDLLILISSSGMSKNITNGCKIARKKKMKIVTLSGFQKNNLLSKKGDINIWINSKVYNIVENIHQIILLLINDLTSIKTNQIK